MSDALLNLARHFVAALNAHDADTLRAMLAPAVRSHGLGGGEDADLRGVEAVLGGLRALFARFPDLTWACTDYAPEGEDAVAFAIVARATEPGSGRAIMRGARARLRADAEGRVGAVEVRFGAQPQARGRQDGA